MSELIFVACRDSGGEPAIAPYRIEVDEHDRADGAHYEKAYEAASEDGYEGPFLGFDSSQIGAVIDAGDEARALIGRSKWLVQGRNCGDDDDTAFVVEAENEAEASQKLMECLVEYTPYKNLEDYDQAEADGTLAECDTIFQILVQKV